VDDLDKQAKDWRARIINPYAEVTMTTEAKVEEALKTMRELSRPLAAAKANRVHIEQFRKSKKAILFSECEEKTIADRENYAYAHPDYLELLEGLKVAVEEEEALKWRMKAAELYIEVWRSQEASNRMVDRGHQ